MTNTRTILLSVVASLAATLFQAAGAAAQRTAIVFTIEDTTETPDPIAPAVGAILDAAIEQINASLLAEATRQDSPPTQQHAAQLPTRDTIPIIVTRQIDPAPALVLTKPETDSTPERTATIRLPQTSPNIDELAATVFRQALNIAIPPTIISVRNDIALIDAGSPRGLKPGDRLVVYGPPQRTLDLETGTFRLIKGPKLAVIKLTRIRPRFSEAAVPEGQTFAVGAMCSLASPESDR